MNTFIVTRDSLPTNVIKPYCGKQSKVRIFDSVLAALSHLIYTQVDIIILDDALTENLKEDLNTIAYMNVQAIILICKKSGSGAYTLHRV